MWIFPSSTAARLAFIAFALLLTASVFSQTHTTGGIEGTVRDQKGALIVGAVVIVSGKGVAEQRTIVTDNGGRFHVGSLAPGRFEILISAGNFLPSRIENVVVSVSGITAIEVVLQVGDIAAGPVITTDLAQIKTDSSTLGRSFDGQTTADLPIATRNVTQLLVLAPGVESFLVDASVVGRNTQAVSVNGARVSQNSFQINGIENAFGTISTRVIANPAPEAIAEFKVQTSLYDAGLGRVGGGIIQTVTRSGTNDFAGSIYAFFGDTSLNANNPFLKAAGRPRPVLERNVFGVTIGGPIKHDRAFFFLSAQATRERNGASLLNSLSSGVLIGTSNTPLTDDRTEATLQTRFNSKIHPISLALLNSLLPNGEFLIPTPQSGSRYYGSAISTFRELQLNANLDYRFSDGDLLTTKVFFANAPQTVARSGVINVPGFPVEQDSQSLSVSIQLFQTFRSDVTNEAPVGTGLTKVHGGALPTFLDSDFGIMRANGSGYPGFPVINIAAAAGGIIFGAPALAHEISEFLTPSFTDTLAFTRQSHAIRVGTEIRYYHFNINMPIQTRGNLTFNDFRSFLNGTTSTTRQSTGITDRAFRTTDYNFFIQDDWKVSRRLTLNLGLRYELDPPPYDTRGRIATFDPLRYSAPANVGGPPSGGLVQAGNSAAGYDVSGIPNVGKRVVNSIDPNNFAPRVGLAYQPFLKRPLVLRAGYGIYYSRSIFSYVVNNIFHPPFYFSSLAAGRNIRDPFPSISTSPNTAPLFGLSFDRNIRTPYVQQFNGAVQLGLSGNSTVEIAYVGSRGINLFRQVAINQASLVLPGGSINGANTNTPAPVNVAQRVPYQGVLPGAGFTQDQTTATSSYHSVQTSLVRRFSRGLQFQGSYTFSKSIDNASGGGGGGSPTGLTDTQLANESSTIIGNQFDSRANRGLSNFDRRHRFAAATVWQVPALRLGAGSKLSAVFANWRISAIVVAMSGLPVDIIDTGAATFYFGMNAGGARPNYVSGMSPSTAVPGYYFNPFAFARPVVSAGEWIPSSNGAARAGASGTDFGNVGRNSIEGPSQFNTDLSISKTLKITESKTLEFRGDIFNVFNTVNLANPISNFNAVNQGDGLINMNTGQITGTNAGDFGRIIATSSNPRVIQLGIKFSF